MPVLPTLVTYASMRTRNIDTRSSDECLSHSSLMDSCSCLACAAAVHGRAACSCCQGLQQHTFACMICSVLTHFYRQEVQRETNPQRHEPLPAPLQTHAFQRRSLYPLSVAEMPPSRMAACRLCAQPKVTKVGTAAAACRTCSAAISSCTPSASTMSAAAQLSWKLCSSPFPCRAPATDLSCADCNAHAP